MLKECRGDFCWGRQEYVDKVATVLGEVTGNRRLLDLVQRIAKAAGRNEKKQNAFEKMAHRHVEKMKQRGATQQEVAIIWTTPTDNLELV